MRAITGIKRFEWLYFIKVYQLRMLNVVMGRTKSFFRCTVSLQ